MKEGNKILICTRTRLFGECLQQIINKQTNYQADLLCNEENLIEYLENEYLLLICDLRFTHYIVSKSLKHEGILLIGEGTSSVLSKTSLKKFMSLGLSGILHPESDSKTLLKAIEKIIRGELWLSRSLLEDSLKNEESGTHEMLTDKETEIFSLICLGLSNRKIAFILKISEKTVKTHCNHIFKKLGVSSRVQLILEYSTVNFPF